jgi:hypothetical protein
MIVEKVTMLSSLVTFLTITEAGEFDEHKNEKK